MPSLGRCSRAVAPGVLLPATALSLLVVPPPAAGVTSTAPPLVALGSPATLQRLGGGSLSLGGSDGPASYQSHFVFPPGADWGPDTWYLIRLEATVELAPDSGPGSLVLSGFSRGQAGAQVEFTSSPSSAGEQRLYWESVDMIHGQRSGASESSTAHISYRNFLPYKGVAPGAATLAFQLERFGSIRASEVKIGSASGIYATQAGPVELKLDASAAEEVLSAGEPAEVKVRVTNVSARPALGVSLAIQPGASQMFIDGSPQRTIERIAGNQSATATFTVGRTTPGQMRLGAVATTPSGVEAQTRLSADVSAPAREDGGAGPWLAAALAALAAAGVGALARAHKRGERS